MPPRDPLPPPDPNNRLSRLLEDTHRLAPDLDLRPGSNTRAILEMVARSSEQTERALLHALERHHHMSPSSAWGPSYGSNLRESVLRRTFREDHEHMTRQVAVGLGLPSNMSDVASVERMQAIQRIYESQPPLSREWILQNIGLVNPEALIAAEAPVETPLTRRPLRGFTRLAQVIDEPNPWIENRPSNPPARPSVDMGLRPTRYLMDQQTWDDIRAFGGPAVEAQLPPADFRVERARQEIMAAEDREIFQALDAAGQALAHERAFRTEYMGVPSPGVEPEPAPGSARALRHLYEAAYRRNPFEPPAFPIDTMPRVTMEEIQTSRSQLRVRPGYGTSTNPCGEIDLGGSGPCMTLEEMEKRALAIRSTAWARLLRDEYPY